MVADVSCETFGHILRAPGVVQVVLRLATIIGWIEQDDVEALVVNWREQVALAHGEVHLIEQRVDARTADCRRIDVDGGYTAVAKCGRPDAARAGAAAQVEHA